MKSLDAIFTDPKKSEVVNTVLGGLETKERELREKQQQLLKDTPNKIAWGAYLSFVGENPRVREMYSTYKSIFLSKEPSFIPEYTIFDQDAYQLELKDRERLLPDYSSLVSEKASDMIETIERDINPLLNPFADFWIYEKDGPEFAEVFEARPKWNEFINRRADEFAFEFTSGDPATDPEQVAAYRTRVAADMEQYKIEDTPDSVLRRIMSGNVDKELMDHYNHSLEHNENHQLEHFMEDDITALAFRNGYISPEADPVAKRFGAH